MTVTRELTEHEGAIGKRERERENVLQQWRPIEDENNSPSQGTIQIEYWTHKFH